MSPLARIGSLKLKLGLLIVWAILVTLVTMLIAAKLGLRLRWGALVALVVALASVHVLARGMTAPLRAMAAAAKAMARGEHGQRVPVVSRDEVGQLAAAFNVMAAELETLDVARRELVADAAHELRTPISALRATLENVVDGVEDADPRELLGQVERLGRLADQLLDLSAIEGGGAPLASAVFPAAALTTTCDVAVTGGAEVAVRGDPERLRQVIVNLVDNAHRHGAGTPVTFRAQARRDGGVRLEVQDAGPGIPAAEADRVFERFARSDRARSVPGSGLGLAIARSIVDRHGGEIRAENVAPHGCRMVVDLP